MTTAAGRTARPLWQMRNLAIFWAAQTLSAAGDSFAYIAVPLLVLRATGSVAQMGLLTGVAGAAAVCAGLGAGAALLGWAAARYGVGPVLIMAGTGCLLLAAATLFTPIRLAAPERISAAA